MFEIASGSSFKDFVLSCEIPVVVKFHSYNCGPCIPVSRLLLELEKETPRDKARFVSVDVERAPELAPKYGVFSIPTVALFMGGQIVSTEARPTRQNILEMIRMASK